MHMHTYFMEQYSLVNINACWIIVDWALFHLLIVCWVFYFCCWQSWFNHTMQEKFFTMFDKGWRQKIVQHWKFPDIQFNYTNLHLWQTCGRYSREGWRNCQWSAHYSLFNLDTDHLPAGKGWFWKCEYLPFEANDDICKRKWCIVVNKWSVNNTATTSTKWGHPSNQIAQRGGQTNIRGSITLHPAPGFFFYWNTSKEVPRLITLSPRTLFIETRPKKSAQINNFRGHPSIKDTFEGYKIGGISS